MYRQNLILLILSFFLPAMFMAQDKKIDSLVRAANKETIDTSRIKLYLKISIIYLNKGSGDSCYLYSHKSRSLSKKQKFISGLAISSSNLGQVKNYMGEADSSAFYFKEALKYFKQLGNINKEAGMLNNLGIVYMEQGNISKSLDYYFRALRIKEFIKDTAGIANVYTNIGNVYSDAKDTANTLKYHTSALNLRRKIKDESGISNSLMAIGLFYQNTDKLDKALPYLEEALKLAEELGEEELIAIGSYNLANVYYKQHNIETCVALYKKSLELSRKNNNPKGVAACLESLGQISLDKHQTKEAISMLEEAYSIAKNIDLKDMVGSVGSRLSVAYESNGDYKKALAYLKISNAVNDSLFTSENIRKLTSEGLKYEHEKERLMLQKEQEKKEAIAKAESFKKNLIISVSILFLVIVSIFSYTILKKLKENRRQKEIIEEQQGEMISSINYAKRIQYALLAHTGLLEQNLPQHFVFFRPKDIVSGDFYWATLKNNFFYLAVCDCTGHGVPGAFMSLLNINYLNEAINEKEIASPHEILNHVRNRLIEKMDGGRDGMDAIIVKIPAGKKDAYTLEYAAANNSPLLVKNRQVVDLPKDSMPVGLGENNNSFTTHSIELQKGDSLYLYTDGFADQFGGPKGKKFKYKQLDNELMLNSDKALNSQRELLVKLFDDWRGDLEQVDDVCVVGIRL